MASLAQMKQYVGENPLSDFLVGLARSINGQLNRVATSFDQAQSLRAADLAPPAELNFTPYFRAERACLVNKVSLIPSAAVLAGADVVHFAVFDAGGLQVAPVGSIASLAGWPAGQTQGFQPLAPVAIPAGGWLGWKVDGGGQQLPATLIGAQVVAALV
jgi:hypothetical protein